MENSLRRSSTIVTTPFYQISVPTRKKIRALGSWGLVILVVGLTAFLSACSGLVSSTSSTAPGITVSISPTTTSVAVNGTAQFTATVQNSSNTAVTWTLSGCSGSTCGSLSSSSNNPVTYTAPATVPTPASVTVTATSAADTTKSASATVTITAAGTVSVSISPATTSVVVNGTAQFTATVQNSSNTAVTWTLSGCSGSTCGSLSSSSNNPVTYTAPATVPTPASVTVTATSAADTTKSASATVTITSLSTNGCLAGPPYTSSVSTAAISKPTTPAMGPAGSIVVDSSLPTSDGSFNQIVRVTDENTASKVSVAASNFSGTASAEVNRWSSDDTHLAVIATSSLKNVIYNFQPDCSQPNYMSVVPDTWDSASSVSPWFEMTFNAVSPAIIAYGITLSVPVQIQSCTHDHLAGSCPPTTIFDLGSRTNIPAILNFSQGSISSTFDQDGNIAVTFAGNVRQENGKIGQDNWDVMIICVKNYDGAGSNGCRFYDTTAQVIGGDFGPKCGTGDGQTAPACTGLPGTFVMHNMRVNHRQDGVLNDLYITAACIGISGAPCEWQVNSTTVSACPSDCLGHRVLGSSFEINNNNGANGDARSWILRPLANESSITQLVNNPPAPTLAQQDMHPMLSVNESWTYNNLFNDSGGCAETTAGECENIAVETNPATPGNATIYRFIHNFETSNQFWAFPKGNVSPSGKFMLFASDWDGTLASGRSDAFVNEMK